MQKTLLDVWKVPKPAPVPAPEIKVASEEFENEYWRYIPKFIDEIKFDELLRELEPLVAEYYAIVSGKEYAAKRLSCKFSEMSEKEKIDESTKNVGGLFRYNDVQWRDWSESLLVCKIRDKLEREFKMKFDYCLTHLYRNGHDNINYHSDHEAMNTPIVSISMGATRKFRFRKSGRTTGYDYQYLLRCGDCILMKVGCQWKWQHCVPTEATIKEPRINLTFRMFE